MATKVLKCCKCKSTESIWSFKTSAMRNKIYVCWECLGECEAKAAERGLTNLFNNK